MTMKARNSARYSDGPSREHTVRFPGAGANGADLFAAVAGQTCIDPLDCVALTEAEAVRVGEAWARRRCTMIGTDLSRLYRVEPLPAGWSNDGAPVPPASVSSYAVDRAEAIHGLGQKPDDELRALAAHFSATAPHATVASNREASEAIVAACERLIARRRAMVPQPCQQQQARHAPGPAMCRDYCAHVADFWGHRAHALAFGSDHRAYDQAWEAWCAYHARAKRGVRFGAWL